jgi:hypothetical protein
LLVSLVGPAAADGEGAAAQAGCPSDDPAVFHPCALTRAKAFNPPRTPDGKPDMQGLWRHRTPAHEDLEAHPKTSDDGGGPSAVVDPPSGKVPMQAWADAQRKENVQKYIDHNVACFQSGVPRHLYAGAYEIRQTAEYIVIVSEEAHAYRIITMDGRPHIGKDILLFQGDSRGRWEENTLVVDTTNQNAKVFLDQRGRFFTEAAHVVERLTMIEEDTIHYQATIEDPHVYTRPFTIAFPLRRNTQEGFEIWEDSCHEGEQDVNILRRLGYKIYPGISAKEAWERAR